MKLRRVVSWGFVLIGILLGIAAIDLGEAFSWWWTEGEAVKVYFAGIAPIITALLAIRNPRLAWKLDFSIAPIVVLFSFGTGISMATTISSLGALILPGVFWLVALRRQWPLPLSKRLVPRSTSVAVFVMCALLFAVFVPALLLNLSAPWWPPVGDCGGRPLLDEDGQPRGIDFTARVLFVPSRILARRYYERSLWAIARVEERFSAPFSAVPNIIILRGHFQPSDRSNRYFVEGRRGRNSLMYFVPTIEPIWCGHTERLDLANLELRILRNGSPMSGGRISGAIYRGIGAQRAPVAGAQVLVQGPGGSTKLVTDAEGVFESAVLPVGEYTVQFIGREGLSGKYVYDLKTHEVAEVKFYLHVD